MLSWWNSMEFVATLNNWMLMATLVFAALTGTLAAGADAYPDRLARRRQGQQESYLLSSGRGAELGILFKNAEIFERTKEVSTVVFDKTGTLTKGEIGVVGIAAANDRDLDRALAITAAVEGDSEHPIAQAVRKAAEEKQLDLLDARLDTGLGCEGCQHRLQHIAV